MASWTNGIGRQRRQQPYRAVHLINQSPTKGISVTAFEKFTGRKPDLSNLRVFESRAVPTVERVKWHPKSELCILIGLSNVQPKELDKRQVAQVSDRRIDGFHESHG